MDRPIIHRRTDPGGFGVKLLSCHYTSGCCQRVGESLAYSILALKEIYKMLGSLNFPRPLCCHDYVGKPLHSPIQSHPA